MTENKNFAGGQTVLLELCTVAAIAFLGFLNGISADELIKEIVFSSVFLLVLYFVMRIRRISVSPKSAAVTAACYVVSLAVILLTREYEIYHLWFLGPVLIGLLIQPYLGVSIHFILVFIFCSLNSCGIEYFCFYFILGAILILLTKYLKKPLYFIYIVVITLTMNVTFLILLNFFVPGTRMSVVMSVLSTLMVLFSSFCAGRIVLPHRKRVRDGSSAAVSFTEMLDQEFELKIQVRGSSKKLYIHSAMVEEIAGRAAAEIGADELLARAGGFYHEIGRLKGKDYIEAGLKLAEDYHFPDTVKKIIAQHNSSFEKPGSKEAAIVMLADSIVSTLDYLEKKNPESLELKAEEIIENVFRNRLNKGALDESGLLISDYIQLKSFFMKNCF